MREIKKGDIVSRHSYGHDIIFSVKRIIKLANKKQVAILKGIDVRVEADAPLEDLKIVTKEEQKEIEILAYFDKAYLKNILNIEVTKNNKKEVIN